MEAVYDPGDRKDLLDGGLDSLVGKIPSLVQQIAARHGGNLGRIVHWSTNILRAMSDDPAAPRPRSPLQQPRLMYLDGLPERPWHDPHDYPVMRGLSDAFETIRGELKAATSAPWEAYRPHEESWTALWLYRHGQRVPATAERFPRLSALVDAHSGCDRELGSEMGDVFLSRMRPGACIAPHYGPSNITLVGHLPLAIPPECGIEVGGEARTWTEGECILFDDTFLHSAWNRSDQDRYVLVFIVWQKDVTPPEREFFRALAHHAYAQMS